MITTYTKDFIPDDSGAHGLFATDLPDRLTVGADVEIRLVYTAPAKGLSRGSKLRVTLPPGFHPVQDADPRRPGYVAAASGARTAIFLRPDLNFGVTLESDLAGGEEVTLVYNPPGGAKKSVVTLVCYRDPVELACDVKPAGEETYRRIFQRSIRLRPEKPHRIFLRVPSVVREGESFDLDINIRDEYDNIAEDFTGIIELSSDRDILDFPARIVLAAADRGSKTLKGACRFKISRVPDSGDDALLAEPRGYAVLPRPAEVRNCQRIHARAEGIAGASNYVLLAGEDMPRIYWGECHVHTRDFSDGMGTMADAFHYMKRVSRFDFGGLGDHSFQGGHPFLPEIPRRDCHLSKADWLGLIEACARETREGEFVAVPGYEWSGRVDNPELPPGWEGGAVSDKNVIFGDYSRANPVVYQTIGPMAGSVPEAARAATPEELYARLAGSDFLAVSHSTSSEPMGTDFSHVDDGVEPVVEIYSMHGANEYYGNPRPLYSTRAEGFVQKALARGKKLGFIAGGDDHHTHPGSARVTSLDRVPMAYLRYRPGITAVLAQRLSLGDIFAALRNRLCYATTGERILVDFRVDGRVCHGQTMTTSGAPVFTCLAAGTAPLEKIELVKDNNLLYCWPGTYEVEKFAYRDDGLGAEEAFYYLRITQKDGEMAWSSPVWLRRR